MRMERDDAKRAGNPEASRRFRPVSRLLHLYWRFSRGMTLGVRAMVLNTQGEVFLVRHSYVPGWHLPGGGVEPGETLLDALAKELDEEARITLDTPPHFHGMFFNSGMSRRDHVAVFVVRDFTLTAPHVPNREIIEAGFHALDALPHGTTLATQRRIREVVHHEPPDAHW
jgi:8-oxo-dGTP pyrophosphatase MutT (NUDIX family)